jgi:hypothetical protein
MMDSTLLNRLAKYVDEHPARTNGSVVCPECGKVFKPTSDWGYGIGEKDYCSWHCVRAAEKRPPKTGRYNGRTSPFEGHEKEMAARLASGETISAVAGEYARSCSELVRHMKSRLGEAAYNDIIKQQREAHKQAARERKKQHREERKRMADENDVNFVMTPDPDETAPATRRTMPTPPDKIAEIRRLFSEGKHPTLIAQQVGVHRSTVDRYTGDLKAKKKDLESTKALSGVDTSPTKEADADVKKKCGSDVWVAIGTLEAVLNMEELSDKGIQIGTSALNAIKEALS